MLFRNINNIFSFGTNKLIKDGATPLTAFDDIIDELGIKRSSPAQQWELESGNDEKVIYECVFKQPVKPPPMPYAEVQEENHLRSMQW